MAPAGAQVSPFGLPAPPLGSQGPCCPLWGWCSAQRIKIVMIAGGNHTSVSCRAAAKGVSLVTLRCYHSTNHTPSVRPFGLPAPPSGSRGIVRIRPRFYKTMGTCRKTPQSRFARQLPHWGAKGLSLSEVPREKVHKSGYIFYHGCDIISKIYVSGYHNILQRRPK